MARDHPDISTVIRSKQLPYEFQVDSYCNESGRRRQTGRGALSAAASTCRCGDCPGGGSTVRGSTACSCAARSARPQRQTCRPSTARSSLGETVQHCRCNCPDIQCCGGRCSHGQEACTCQSQCCAQCVSCAAQAQCHCQGCAQAHCLCQQQDVCCCAETCCCEGAACQCPAAAPAPGAAAYTVYQQQPAVVAQRHIPVVIPQRAALVQTTSLVPQAYGAVPQAYGGASGGSGVQLGGSPMFLNGGAMAGTAVAGGVMAGGAMMGGSAPIFAAHGMPLPGQVVKFRRPLIPIVEKKRRR